MAVVLVMVQYLEGINPVSMVVQVVIPMQELVPMVKVDGKPSSKVSAST